MCLLYAVLSRTLLVAHGCKYCQHYSKQLHSCLFLSVQITWLFSIWSYVQCSILYLFEMTFGSSFHWFWFTLVTIWVVISIENPDIPLPIFSIQSPTLVVKGNATYGINSMVRCYSLTMFRSQTKTFSMTLPCKCNSHIRRNWYDQEGHSVFHTCIISVLSLQRRDHSKKIYQKVKNFCWSRNVPVPFSYILEGRAWFSFQKHLTVIHQKTKSHSQTFPGMPQYIKSKTLLWRTNGKTWVKELKRWKTYKVYWLTRKHGEEE